MKNEITFDEIISFIRYYLNDYMTPIDSETRLQHDLRIYGYDAEDFFLEFSKKFNIDFNTINLNQHFSGEGGVWKPWLWGKLSIEDQSNKIPFTVQILHDLVNQKQ